MPDSPQLNADGVLRISVLSNGIALDASMALIRATVRRQLNHVPSATLVFEDGDMPTQTFPLGDGDTFKLGAPITVKAGWGDDEATLFKGIVVRQGQRIHGDNRTELHVECRDTAVAMTLSRHTATYLDQTDAAVMSSLIHRHPGLTAEVSGKTLQHAQLIQHACSDWDFLLARAAANGCVVAVTDGTVTVAEPHERGDAVLAAAYGESLIDFEATVEARPTGDGVQARGRMTFLGSAKAALGSFIELQGVGARFKGRVAVSGLTHTLAGGQWFTECEFGATPASPPEHARIEDRHFDVVTGVVTQLHADPAGQHRVQVKPCTAGLEPVWARLMQPLAGQGFGTFFVPEVGDEVVIGCLGHAPEQLVVLGSLHGSTRAPGYALEGDNRIKAIVTRCGHRLEFDDHDRLLTLSTPARNRLVFSDQGRSITITDQHHNQLVLDGSGIRLDSPKDIVIKAQGAISLDAVGAVNISTPADVRVQGLNVACTAQVGFSGRGSASAELSAAGQTTVKGALVMIN